MSPCPAPRFLRFPLALLTAAALAACGGGGGGAGGAATAVSPAAPVDGGGAAPTPGAGDVVQPVAAVAYDAAKIPARASGLAVEQVQHTGRAGFPTDIGAFRIHCDYSHMATDDPIVHPNQPGRSHLHTFFGNTGTDARSTADSIARAGASTCRGGTVNRSAYWVPSMIDTRTGAPLKPGAAMIYYKTGYNGIRPEEVQVMPQGLRMIAGDAFNATPAGPFKFVCVGGGAEHMTGQEIQNCPAGSQLWQLIHFPQCWDGVNLDSPDHRSHMSFPVAGRCPRTHPVALPEVSYNIVYDVTEHGAPKHWRLSSDTYDRTLPGGYSSHADWFNGWNPEIMKTFIERCDRASVDCHANLLGDGRELQ